MKNAKGNPEIKNRFNGSIIIPAGKYTSIKEAVEKEYANLRFADLRSANLSFANLRFADLRSADLSFANLRFVDLSFADLRFADLSSADLRSADLRFVDLRSAKHCEPIIYADLYYFLLLQDKVKMKAWKYLLNGKSPYQHHDYEIGKKYIFNDIDKNKSNLCGKGGNVATLNWCLKDNLEADEFLEVEFEKEDVVVPYYTDGKFRVSKFVVLRKINRKEAIKLIENVS